MNLISAANKGAALLADIEHADPGEGFCCWWLGQSGFLIKTASGKLLFDPYLSDSLTDKYAATDKPHIRMSECVAKPAELTGLDAITSSHNHTDHLDAQTLKPLLEANPQATLLIPSANNRFVAERLGIDKNFPCGLNDGESVTIGAFTFHGIAAAHNAVDRDTAGCCKYLGYVVEFATPAGRMAIYHSGDTLWHDALVEQLSSFDITLALLPINGNLPTRRVAGNLWGQEAAELAGTIGAHCVVPCHYDMFTFNTQTTDAFTAACERLGQPFRVLLGGERLDIQLN